ncbi:helix-turn-helix domain-containing protein [Mycolicibacterium fluoranthenivorans]|uniref:helix-turn-helix domain-containing protein n=1 Tax=Mycolicibacterium fluoranthenivorans TaxID=258505 RepID=UPI001422290D|nr:helix-turn-helix transcriptional regulator [Mycolicibacterium fluoranthenivorans]MCV7355343.1 helix-turn-helix transcriptional regulator [Mycolicibacterium fluoranthenivorans]
MPTRPSQNSPERVAAWERRRAAVGRRIRELRQKRGLTQEQLALKSGVTRPILNEVENGKRGLLFERLYDIAEALDVPASELMAE